MAYERVAGPVGQQRDDALTALICAATHNAMSGSKKPTSPANFLPRWGDTTEEDDVGDDP